MKKANNTFYSITVMVLMILCSAGSCSESNAGQGGNVVRNGGFELLQANLLPDGWEIIPAYKKNGTAIADKEVINRGQHSIKIMPGKKNTSEAFGVFQMLNASELKGKEITIKGFIRTKNISDTVAILLNTDKENWFVLPKNTGNKFVSFNKNFSISNSISKVGLLLLVSGTTGSVWFDDISVEVTHKVSKQIDTQSPATGIVEEYVDKINTPGWQDSVYISGDGQELYLAYLPFVQKDFMDLYFGRVSEKQIKERGPFRPGSHGKMNFETYKAVRKKNGSWGTPVNLNINSTYSLYSAKLSHDGTELYYAIRDYKGNYGADDIYVSNKLSDGNWSKPKNLGPNINTMFREDTPCLTADGKTMYFGHNKHEMLGWEIMVSYRENGKWSKAKRFEEPINQKNPKTTANYQPFITSDGEEFYFTRIQQLYMSSKQSDGKWGKPVKVFPKLPVSAHASVTDDNKYLFFLSTKDKKSLKREHWTIWFSERKEDGSWGKPKIVD